MGSNTGFQCCSWTHSPQAVAQRKAVNVLSFAVVPQIRLSSNPLPPLRQLLSAHIPFAWAPQPHSGAIHPASLGAGLITGSSAGLPSVQRDGLCLPIFQMFKSGVLSRSLQGPTRSSGHTGRARNTCGGAPKGFRMAGPRRIQKFRPSLRNEPGPPVPTRGSRGKRPSHTLRGPKPRKAERSIKRQRTIQGPPQLSACEG